MAGDEWLNIIKGQRRSGLVLAERSAARRRIRLERRVAGRALPDARRGGGVEAALASGRPSMALWGPSQSGNSRCCPGIWTRQRTRRRSGLAVGSRVAGGVCGAARQAGLRASEPLQPAARRVGLRHAVHLCREVPEPRHPVELKLATEEQALHALAAGYVMECDTRTAKGREVFHEAAGVDRKLFELKARFRARAAAAAGPGTLADGVERAGRFDRRRLVALPQLGAGLEQPASRLASDPLLRADAAALGEFGAWLFWDPGGVERALAEAAGATRQDSQTGGGALHCLLAPRRAAVSGH